MAGHFYQLPGEKGWRVQIDAGIDPGTGQRVRIRLPGRGKPPFPTKRDAEQAAARLLVERNEGRVADTRYAILSQFLLDRWLPARRARGLKATTLASYEWIVSTYIVPRLGALKLAETKPHHVTSMILDLADQPGRGGRKRSARTLEVTRRVLSMAMADAVRWGLIPRNPVDAAQADMPRKVGGRRGTNIWTPGELRTFVDVVEDDRLYALWLLAITTGMRRGELCGLEWTDVDLEHRRLTIRRNRVMVAGRAETFTPKTLSGQRTISIDLVTVKALSARKQQEEADRLACPPGQWRECGNVFRDTLGRPIFPESLTKRFRVLVKQAGLPSIRLHDVRHSYATAALEAGEDIETLSKRLGHSSSVLTRSIYLHAVEELDREMADSVAGLILGKPSSETRRRRGESRS